MAVRGDVSRLSSNGAELAGADKVPAQAGVANAQYLTLNANDGGFKASGIELFLGFVGIGLLV